jgi:hypothetical protein
MDPLRPEEAEIVLDPYFEAVRVRFIEAGLRRTEKTKLEIDKGAHDKLRHFAAARDDGRLVIVAPEFADLPEDQVVAILAHELGHAADFLYPGRFQLAAGELIDWPSRSWSEEARKRKLEDPDAREAFNRARQWSDRPKDEVERTADAIATLVFGRPIRYTGPCMLQSFSRGSSPRPLGLR